MKDEVVKAECAKDAWRKGDRGYGSQQGCAARARTQQRRRVVLVRARTEVVS